MHADASLGWSSGISPFGTMYGESHAVNTA
jgi:hypothetical protein